MEYFMNNLITKEKIYHRLLSLHICACEKQIKYKLMVILNLCRFLSIYLYIQVCIAMVDPIIMREDWGVPLKRGNRATIVYLSQPRNWISNIICCGLFFCDE